MISCVFDKYVEITNNQRDSCDPSSCRHDLGMTMSIPTWTRQEKHHWVLGDFKSNKENEWTWSTSLNIFESTKQLLLAHPVTTIGCLVFLMVFFVFLQVSLLGLFKAACVTMCQTRHAWPKWSVWQTPNLGKGEIVSAVPKGHFVHTHDRWNMMESHPHFSGVLSLCLWESDSTPIWSKVDKLLEIHGNPMRTPIFFQ